MLLERDRELGLMADLLAGVDSAGGKLVLLRGEAGIGKSSLVTEFVETNADEALFLYGSCDDLLTPPPLGPFWDFARDEPSLAEPRPRFRMVPGFHRPLALETRGAHTEGLLTSNDPPTASA